MHFLLGWLPWQLIFPSRGRVTGSGLFSIANKSFVWVCPYGDEMGVALGKGKLVQKKETLIPLCSALAILYRPCLCCWGQCGMYYSVISVCQHQLRTFLLHIQKNKKIYSSAEKIVNMKRGFYCIFSNFGSLISLRHTQIVCNWKGHLYKIYHFLPFSSPFVFTRGRG